MRKEEGSNPGSQTRLMMVRLAIRLALLLLTALPVQAATTTGSISPAKRYSITDDGAKGDARTLNTRAVQATIERCAAQGGGVVVVPKGTFLTGSIFLKQGCNLEVSKGGVLKGSVNPQDYPQVKTRWEGVEREWTAALVNADEMNGLELSGEGTIDGSGEQWAERLRQATQMRGQRAGRPRLIAIENCRNVRVAGLNLLNQASWGLHVLYSEDVLIERLIIRAAHNIPSSDGIDIDSSRRVRVTRCDIDVNDDCISIKAGRDEDGLRVGRPSEEIIIEQTRFGYGHGGVAMGSETSGGIRNVEVRDCVAEADNWAPVRFKSQPSRGGVVEKIVFRNIKLRGVRRAFEMNMEWTSARGTLGPPAKVLPVFRDIQLINVSGTAQSGGMIRGLKGSPIQEVRFKDCKVTAQKGLVVEHARRMDFSGLRLEVREGESIVRRDVE
ncbi:MAG TPA: glycoside hydrolase family 28 protein [Pyrinomonadaceae bacterium]